MKKIYAASGDDGYSGFLGEGRVPKYHPRIELVGEIDEASASLGFARSVSKSPETGSLLLIIQRDLYHIMAEVAASPENASRFRKIDDARVRWLEEKLEEINQIVQIPNVFILPGDTVAGGALSVARTVVRRAERHLAMLFHQGEITNQDLLRYLNRVSSLCFSLELLENKYGGKSDSTVVNVDK
jgi:cob(I)alamin adenosyltransferase